VTDVFCGYDERESVGFHVFVSSLLRRASGPVSIRPLGARGLLEGTNSFTLSRFLVPELMQYRGRAIFVDACDMLMQADIAELEALFDERYAVQVVKHPSYETRHPLKYRGTEMMTENRNYWRKNWASVMIINCAHPAWKRVAGALRQTKNALPWLQFDHMTADEIGGLPDHWNRLVDEGHAVENAKILHWTAGIPGFVDCYSDAPGAALWRAARDVMERAG
jgi:hypothetical protein